MLYEKKMLILSGDGKGVVLIEKSARGVRFSLSTFDMPVCGVLKAGVITPQAVHVRDLPQRENPSSVFILDIDRLDNLHFAVFDDRLRLYGTNGKRMWESNVMDLLCKNDRRPQNDDRMPLGALPPIAEMPKVLPMPDGTGLPQSRLALYGDEAIAESNFYTPLDIPSRMPIVDKFLDEPRLLDGLAPRIMPKSAPIEAETTAVIDVEPTDAQPEPAQQVETKLAENIEPEQPTETETIEKPETVKAAESVTGESPVEKVDVKTLDDNNVMSAAAATVTAKEMPWALQARWIKSRGKRGVRFSTSEVKPIAGGAKVKPLREVSFIERAAADIDKLFAGAEKDDKLTSLLPDLQWVKVPTDGHIISVGRGGNDFLCYAVTGTYQKTSPLGDEAQWLPENKSIPTGKGYWLIFQSLKDGNIIIN